VSAFSCFNAFALLFVAVVVGLTVPMFIEAVVVPSLEMPVTKALVLDVQFSTNCVLSDRVMAVGLPSGSTAIVCQVPSGTVLWISYSEVGFPLESLVPRNVSVLPSLFGVIKMRLSVMSSTNTLPPVALGTVRLACPAKVPLVAVIVAVPAATGVTNPVLLTVATAGVEDVQVALLEISPTLPLLYVPVAEYCSGTPMPRVSVVGLTCTEERVGAVTVNIAAPVTGPPPVWAEIFAWPAVRLATSPLAETVATAELEEDHPAVDVTS
jgi:hypothetical protein